MHDGVASVLGPPAYELHYEDLQRAPSAYLGALLAAVGAGRLDERALGRSGLIKGSSDSLHHLLLNVHELHAAFAHAPCLQVGWLGVHTTRLHAFTPYMHGQAGRACTLPCRPPRHASRRLTTDCARVPRPQRMLSASTPQRFAADCDTTVHEAADAGAPGSRSESQREAALAEPEAHHQTPRPDTAARHRAPPDTEAEAHHQAKQDTAVRVLACRGVPHRGPSACEIASMNREAAEAVATLALAAGAKAKKRARRGGGPLRGVVNLPPQTDAAEEGGAAAASASSGEGQREWAAAQTAAARTAAVPTAPAGMAGLDGSPARERAALIAGRCTAEEEHMCALAVNRSRGGEGGGGAVVAEVCVLRAVGE